MAIVVQKYGGSSVGDVEKIGRVADKVVACKRAGNDVVVVVSAMGKTTDELIALARRASTGTEPPRRELDMLVSTGERVSMALLSIAIAARGLDVISFTGSQSGIITSDRHFDARIIEVRPHRIEDELARGKIVIVAGYQGMSYRREITTLGRGGTDTTAVALAAALSADRCEIYSDVDGVYSADPRIVPEAEHLPLLDLATLQEMAEAGAKVVNAQAVEWARRAKITIHARRTSDEDVLPGGGVSPKETIASEHQEPARARAIVGMDRVVAVELSSLDLERFAASAASLAVPLTDVAMTGSRAMCTIALLNVPDWERCGVAFASEFGDRVTFTAGRAVVSVVGDGLTTSSRALPQFLAALNELGITTTSVQAGPLRLSAVIDSARLTEAQRKLHAVFVAHPAG